MSMHGSSSNIFPGIMLPGELIRDSSILTFYWLLTFHIFGTLFNLQFKYIWHSL